MNPPEKETRTPGWMGAAAAHADEILAKCERRGRADVADVETLRKMLFDVADEAIRLQGVVEKQSARIVELRHSNRATDKATGPAS